MVDKFVHSLPFQTQHRIGLHKAAVAYSYSLEIVLPEWRKTKHPSEKKYQKN